MAAVVVDVLTVGLATVVLALVYPPLAGPRRLLAYSLIVFAAGVGVVVANVWAAVGGRH